MKIIFLDIDGVLCTSRSHIALSKNFGGEMDEWDTVAAEFLRKCCAAPNGPKIVISSTWRKFCQNPRDNSDILGVRLKQCELTDFLHEDWRTKDFGLRGREIAEWLSRHKEVDDYRVIDDDVWDMEDIDVGKIVQTDFDNGISAAQMIELRKWSFDLTTSSVSRKDVVIKHNPNN